MAAETATGIGVWFRDEIEAIIRAVDVANMDVARHIETPEMRLYRLGYEAAIDALATAFGVGYVRVTGLPERAGLVVRSFVLEEGSCE